MTSMASARSTNLPRRAGVVARGATSEIHRLLFQDLLGRPPLPEEREGLAGASLEDVARALIGTAPFWRHWVEEQLYYFFLVDGFRPPDEELELLVNELRERRIGTVQALHRICLLASFDRRNPGPDTFVTVVMEQVVGDEVQRNQRELAIGKKVYDGAPGTFYGAKGSSQADVVQIAIGLDKSLRHYLARAYGSLLRAEPSAKDLASWARRLAGEPKGYPELVAEWLQTPPYDQRLASRVAMPNRLFVQTLFVDLFQRLPSASECQQLRAALDGMADSSPLRSLLSRLLIDSKGCVLSERSDGDEASAWVRDRFLLLLGREPTREETEAYVGALEREDCRPQSILQAMVTSVEYQTW